MQWRFIIYVLQKYHGKKSGTVIYRSGTGNSSANSNIFGWGWEENYRALGFYTKMDLSFDKHVFH
jgi:hypothetical protein